MNPNDIGLPVGDSNFEVGQPGKTPTLQGANHELVVGDFPFHDLIVPDIAGDPKCTPAINATVNAGVLENIPRMATVNPTTGAVTAPVCDAGNIRSTTNDVASSMGVSFRSSRTNGTRRPSDRAAYASVRSFAALNAGCRSGSSRQNMNAREIAYRSMIPSSWS